GVPEAHQIIAVALKFLANPNSRPRPPLVGEIQFFLLSHTSHFRHFCFELLIPVAEPGYLLEIIFPLAGEVVPLSFFTSQRSLKLSSSLGDFSLLLLFRQLLASLKLGNLLGQGRKPLLQIFLS